MFNEENINRDIRTLEEYKELLEKCGILHFDSDGNIIELKEKYKK